ncbi:MAG: signal peptide peptidase SppA [Bryobacteraceae bacterium]
MKKFLLGIVAGIVIAGVALVVLFFAAVRWSAQTPSVPASGILAVNLTGDVPEGLADVPPIPALARQAPLAMVEWWNLLRAAGRDPRVKGLLLRPRQLSAGWGKMQELRTGIETFKRSRKPVYAWLETPSLREYYLASAADRIYLAPEDYLDVKGLRLEAMYFKGTLDKLGVQFEVEHMGKYKDAGDMFTRKDMSPETKESLNALLDGIWDNVTSTIGPARRMKPEQFRALVDQAPMLAPAAVKSGLVDELSYLPAVQLALTRKAGLAAWVSISPQLLLSDIQPPRKSQRIAYLVAEGDILRGAPDNPWGREIGITPAPVTRLVKSIADDATIKGVIVRVESPGGDAIASDEILESLKDLARRKPVVVSMSDVAASGGYYIAMTGDPVVAYPTTITGSIGVIYGKANVKGLYDKLGFSTETLTRGRFADIDSATKPMSPEGRKKLQESLQSIYSAFLKHVAEGRKSKVEAIEPLAQGRVWIGSDAYKNHLVDELGGIDRAVELLQHKGALAAGVEAKLIVYPGRKSFWEMLLGMSDNAASASQTPEEWLLVHAGAESGVLPYLEGGMLRVMPFRIQIR